MSKEFTKKILFIALFVMIGFGAMQVPFSKIIGAGNMKFSLFDFYGPIAAAFVGSVWGIIAVGAMQIANWGWHGFNVDAAAIIRLFPVLFSVLYFAKKSRWALLAPAICMIAFWIHPEGRAAWYYALYWLIPIASYFFYDRFLFARALGTTFTAHAVGSALFAWFLNLKSAVWISLIPVVWKERVLMAIGIMLTYMAFNYIMSLLLTRTKLQLPFLKINPKYSTNQK